MLKKALILLLVVVCLTLIVGCENVKDIKEEQSFSELAYSWSAYIDSYRYIETVNPLPVLLSTQDELLDYCIANNMTLAVDSNGCFTNAEIGKALSKYDNNFFLNNTLIFIPSSVPSTMKKWPIVKVYEKDSELFVIKKDYPLDYGATADERPIIYLIEIENKEFIDISAIKYGNMMQESAWKDYIE